MVYGVLKMREITINEMSLVSGAASNQEIVAGGSAIGAGVGASGGAGIATKEAIAITAGRAGLGAVAGGAVTTAFLAGYGAGQWLNENTPIQEWIADGIDKLTSKDGNDYCEDGSDY